MKEKVDKIGVIILAIGLIIIFLVMAIYPAGVKGAGTLEIVGTIIATVGVYIIVKDFKGGKKFFITLGFLAICLALVFVIDLIDTQKNNHPPRFAIAIETLEDMIVYKTPFYDVYRINKDTQNEYYIVDQKKEYTPETIPTSEFNRVKTGIDKIINYHDKYVGNNVNDGNLIAHLPLSEYGYTFEIDSVNYGLIINYKTAWEGLDNDELYMKKALIYNTVSTFALIENVKYLKINFTDKTFEIQRDKIENTYPNYRKIVIDKEIIRDNFNKYVEDMVKDEEFVQNVYKSIY